MSRIKTGKRGGVKKEDGRGKIKLAELFEVYKAWKGLPTIWRGMSTTKLNELGVDDPNIRELLSIRTQRDFAEKFKINEDTTTAWNKKLFDIGVDYLDEARKWARLFTKNVVAAHYKKAVRRFDPMTGDLWYKVIEGFNEKKQIEHSGKLSLLDLAKEIDDDEEDSKKKSHTKNTQ